MLKLMKHNQQKPQTPATKEFENQSHFKNNFHCKLEESKNQSIYLHWKSTNLVV